MITNFIICYAVLFLIIFFLISKIQALKIEIEVEKKMNSVFMNFLKIFKLNKEWTNYTTVERKEDNEKTTH